MTVTKTPDQKMPYAWKWRTQQACVTTRRAGIASANDHIVNEQKARLPNQLQGLSASRSALINHVVRQASPTKLLKEALTSSMSIITVNDGGFTSKMPRS